MSVRISSPRVRKAVAEAFGRRLDAILTRRGITTKELANRCNCSYTYAQKLRKGSSAPTVVTLYMLRRALDGIGWDELLGG